MFQKNSMFLLRLKICCIELRENCIKKPSYIRHINPIQIIDIIITISNFYYLGSGPLISSFYFILFEEIITHTHKEERMRF